MAEEPIVNNPASENNPVLPTTTKAADETKTPTATPSPVATPPESAESFRDRLEKAKLAMEGPERTLKREEEETEEKVKTETADIEKQLALINHKKEKLEINWVVLDTKANELKTLLSPLKKEEEAIELEEDQLEGEEHTTTDVTARQDIEKKRWAAQDKRKDLEKRKWELENKILDIDKELKKNTTEYQSFLDEEEVLKKKLETLEYEIQAAKERVRQEEEKVRQEEEARMIAAEEKRRAEAKRQAEAEEEKKKADTLAQKKAEEETRLKLEDEKRKVELEQKKKADEERLKKIAEEQKLRAELETKRQQEAQKNKIESGATQIDEDKKRAELLEKARQASLGVKPVTAEDLPPQLETADLTEQKIEGNIEPAAQKIDSEDDVPSFGPNESSAIPSMRTFRSDVENMLTPEQIKEAKKKFPWLK
ncbi:MAG: hypothetical protein QG665_372 [Patescibacteria group bacterium]|nr:hypothetical protein [Patescibacteria group bacterium]